MTTLGELKAYLGRRIQDFEIDICNHHTNWDVALEILKAKVKVLREVLAEIGH